MPESRSSMASRSVDSVAVCAMHCSWLFRLCIVWLFSLLCTSVGNRIRPLRPAVSKGKTLLFVCLCRSSPAWLFDRWRPCDLCLSSWSMGTNKRYRADCRMDRPCRRHVHRTHDGANVPDVPADGPRHQYVGHVHWWRPTPGHVPGHAVLGSAADVAAVEHDVSRSAGECYRRQCPVFVRVYLLAGRTLLLQVLVFVARLDELNLCRAVPKYHLLRCQWGQLHGRVVSAARVFHLHHLLHTSGQRGGRRGTGLVFDHGLPGRQYVVCCCVGIGSCCFPFALTLFMFRSRFMFAGTNGPTTTTFCTPNALQTPTATFQVWTCCVLLLTVDGVCGDG